ncbi:MAG: hypothetical protein COA79_18560 [Planctomycetota bacterium]|nr:MAG: hypothetical protein COA79_18560 [Planctomycetota bacterium]
MIRKLFIIISLLLFTGHCFSDDYPKYKDRIPYKDDTTLVKLIQALPPMSSMLLPQVKVIPTNAAKWFKGFKNGPGRRNYGNKMVYAPERKTALYCGANHGVPHIFNDAWEYHLGSNTWILLSPPDGGNHHMFGKARINVIRGRDKDGTNKKFVTEWYKKNIVFEDGYLQTRHNHGPIYPRHTWDGLSYDPVKKRMLWAVLDKSSDKRQLEMLSEYAKATGKNFETLKKGFKKGSSLYMFEPALGRWFRQLGEGSKPRLFHMGGALIYIPHLKKSIWYAPVENLQCLATTRKRISGKHLKQMEGLILLVLPRRGLLLLQRCRWLTVQSIKK